MKKCKPSPPPDLSTEATHEWEAVCASIAAEGREVKKADVSLLTLYIRNWQTFFTAYQHVKQYGPVVKWANGMPGQSPQYKVTKEMATLLAKMLDQLGCTPAARDFDAKASDDEPVDITF